MNWVLTSLAALLAAGSACGAAEDPVRDLRAELPRDVRIVLLGVPSVKAALAAEENLRKATLNLESDLANESTAPARLDQDRARVFFRIGQLDETLAVLRRSLRDQERIKGLEEYRDLARSLDLHSEVLATLSGTSEAPLVQEDDDAGAAGTGVTGPADLVRQLKVELPKMDQTLRRIEARARPDEERKMQLERDVGALGQFVFQIRNLTEDLRAAETSGRAEIRVDSGEIVRSVQGLIDGIRDIKREKERRKQ